MGNWGNTIRQLITDYIITGRKNKAADLRVVCNGMAEAVDFLEGLQRGALILNGSGQPDAADGNNGDAYIDTDVSDMYLKENGAWSLRIVLRGANGKSAYESWLSAGNSGSEADFIMSLRGANGKSAYQSWLASGNSGTEADFAEYMRGKKGDNGKSAYELWVAAGNVGTLAEFLEGMNPKPADGNKNRWESYAPTTEAGRVGDAWYHSIAANKIALYEYIGVGFGQQSDSAPTLWRLRFTSPDAPTSSSSGTVTGVSSFNNRNGAVGLLADDVLAVMMNGTNTTVSKDATGKLRIDATATGNGNYTGQAIEGASIAGNILTFSRGNGNSVQITLPNTGGSGSAGPVPTELLTNSINVVAGITYRFVIGTAERLWRAKVAQTAGSIVFPVDGDKVAPGGTYWIEESPSEASQGGASYSDTQAATAAAAALVAANAQHVGITFSIVNGAIKANVANTTTVRMEFQFPAPGSSTVAQFNKYITPALVKQYNILNRRNLQTLKITQDNGGYVYFDGPASNFVSFTPLASGAHTILASATDITQSVDFSLE